MLEALIAKFVSHHGPVIQSRAEPAMKGQAAISPHRPKQRNYQRFSPMILAIESKAQQDWRECFLDGRVRSFHVPSVTAENIKPIIAKNADKASMLMTDESVVYTKLGKDFAAHGTANHSASEYARLGGFVGINASSSLEILC